MDRPVIIFIAVVTVVSLVIAVLLFVLFLQRRRQRAMLMLAIAQEEAERRRRKRKKAGLRKWEIDFACPEALVSEISTTTSAVELYSVQQNPSQYAEAIRALKTAGLVSPDACFPDSMPNELLDAPALFVDDLDLPKAPELLSVKEKEKDAAVSAAKSAASEQTDDLPLQVLRLPESMGTCVICLDDITLGARVRSLPCGHVYHSQCIRVWLRRKNACPCCCVKVIKRRKKRSRQAQTALEDDSTGLVPVAFGEPDVQVVIDEQEEMPSPQPTSPRSPSPRPSPRSAELVYEEELLPSTTDRPADRCEEISLDMTEPRSKSLGHSGGRPRSSGVQHAIMRARMGSYLDSEDVNSDVLTSETSSHLEEPSAAELLYQVRRALRGESSMLSLNTSIDDTSEVPLSEQLTLPDIKLDGDPHSFRRELESMNSDDLEAGGSSGRLGGAKADKADL